MTANTTQTTSTPNPFAQFAGNLLGAMLVGTIEDQSKK